MTTMEFTPHFQTCVIHEAPVVGVVYFCPSCNRWFCNDCVHFYISDVRACPACGFSVDMPAIEKHADDSGFPGEKVTVISQDVIDEMDRLEIDDDIFDEVVYAVKVVPPDQRVAYLRQMFSGSDENAGNDAMDDF